jgi:spore maturation protein CgeB
LTAPSVLLIAPFDDVEHAHSAQRARALERLGCDVTTFDLQKRPGLLGRLAGSDLRSRLLKSLEVAEAQLALVIGGYDLDEALVDALRSASGVKFANWFPGDMSQIGDMLRCARGYDAVFVAGSDVAAAFERSLGRTVEVLPLAADPSIYRPIRSKDHYRANVVFAGAATPVREKFLSDLAEFGLALWGPGWRRTTLRDYCRGELKTTAEYVRAYGGASVAVNLHHGLAENTLSTAYCNQRVFEVASMGIAQVVDFRGDLARWFDVGRDLVTYITPDELKAQVQELLQTTAKAEEIGSAGRREVLRRHTHMHRAQQLLESLGMLPREAPVARDPVSD